MLIALVLICGVLAGAALAAVGLRRSRERMREELTAVSAEVLSRTGESLAGRMDDARRAEQERAAGEMARRAEEIKGVVGPVAERLVRMENEIGRLERERVKAQGELAQMVRQLGEGVGTLREEAANLASALRRPATRGAWGELQLRNVVEMAGMVEHCDFFEQHTIAGEDGDAAPGHARAAPGREGRGGRLEGPARRLPVRDRGRQRAGARAARRCATRARRGITSRSWPRRATSAGSSSRRSSW